MQLSKENMAKKYEQYIDKNRKEIINDFCSLIKETEEGDITLEEYGRFRFWQKDQTKNLKEFYIKFKEDIKDSSLEYLEFCRLLWAWLNDMPSMYDELDLPSEIIDSIENISITGEA